MKAKFPKNIAVQTFDLDYYNSLSPELQTRFLKCLDSGRENPDSEMGCYANNPDDYETFKPFFKRALEVYHKVDLSKQKHVNDWNFAGVSGLPASGVLDLSKLGLPPLSMRVRTGRNLNRFPLPASMTKEDRVALELEMGKVGKLHTLHKDVCASEYTHARPIFRIVSPLTISLFGLSIVSRSLAFLECPPSLPRRARQNPRRPAGL